jgi:hypothetical protein
MKMSPHTRLGGLRLVVIAAFATLGASTSLAAQSAQCATVMGAMIKMFDVPFHLYMVDSAGTDAGLHGGKPTVSEEVFAGGAVYVMVDGKKWTKSPVSIAEMKKDQAESSKKLSGLKATCTHLRDESVNGESASVWHVKSETEDGESDTNEWVSKSRNVVLRSEMRMDVGGALGKSHMVMNYDYANVHAPAGVQ